MFRPCFPSVILALLALSLPTTWAAEESKKDAELRWAKGVAEDFLNAAFWGELEQAESLLDATFKKAFATQGEKRLREWLNNSIGTQGFRSPVVSSEEISPDQDEASFKGTFKGISSPYQFSLRVVKDKESGKWRVNYLQFNEVKKAK